jgi:hypothetical protein
MKSWPGKVLACISIALVLNVAACDVVAAADGTGTQPDSSSAKPGKLEAPAPSVSARGTPLIMSEDGLDELPVRQPGDEASPNEDAGEETPFYKNKWLWAACLTLVAGTATAIIIGRGEKAGKDLPDFPEPPAR